MDRRNFARTAAVAPLLLISNPVKARPLEEVDATQYRLKGEVFAGELPTIAELNSNASEEDIVNKINALIAHANLSRLA